jgi:hypothetical protein
MKSKVGVLMLGVLLCCGLAQAIQTDFHTDATIHTGDVYDTVDTWDTATVTMIGGTANVIETRNSSAFQLQGGNVTGWISGYNASAITISGGSVAYGMQVYDSTITNILGGDVGTVSIYGNLARIHIYGQDFNLAPVGGLYNGLAGNGWTIQGTWADGAQFSIFYRGVSLPSPDSPNSMVILNSIPEPTTISVLLLGIALARKLHQ